LTPTNLDRAMSLMRTACSRACQTHRVCVETRLVHWLRRTGSFTDPTTLSSEFCFADVLCALPNVETFGKSILDVAIREAIVVKEFSWCFDQLFSLSKCLVWYKQRLQSTKRCPSETLRLFCDLISSLDAASRCGNCLIIPRACLVASSSDADRDDLLTDQLPLRPDNATCGVLSRGAKTTIRSIGACCNLRTDNRQPPATPELSGRWVSVQHVPGTVSSNRSYRVGWYWFASRAKVCIRLDKCRRVFVGWMSMAECHVCALLLSSHPSRPACAEDLRRSTRFWIGSSSSSLAEDARAWHCFHHAVSALLERPRLGPLLRERFPWLDTMPPPPSPLPSTSPSSKLVSAPTPQDTSPTTTTVTLDTLRRAIYVHAASLFKRAKRMTEDEFRHQFSKHCDRTPFLNRHIDKEFTKCEPDVYAWALDELKRRDIIEQAEKNVYVFL